MLTVGRGFGLGDLCGGGVLVLVGAGGGGLLTTAGRVVFSGDGSGNFAAFDATNGDALWHSRIGNISNAPQTYLVDGKQHVLVAVGDALYAFSLY